VKSKSARPSAAVSSPPPAALCAILSREVMTRSGRREGREIRFQCPAHDDHSPSARWNPKKAVWHCDACGAGGGALDLAKRLGVELPVMAVHSQVPCQRVYAVRDAAGSVVAEHIRIDDAKGKKRFFWRRDGRSGLGRLRTAELPLYGTERVADYDRSRPLFVVEGEKAAEHLQGIGAQAVGTVTGASAAPGAGPLSVLRGWEVVLWPDADAPGARHMERIAAALASVAPAVRTFAPLQGLPAGGDAADWIEQRCAAGKPAAAMLSELEAMAREAPSRAAAPARDHAGGAGRPADAVEAAEPPQPAAHRSVFRSLAEILEDPAALDPPQPLVPRLAWQGRVTLLAGREKDGKSTLASAAAAAVSRGAVFLEGPALQGAVLYLALEEHESDVARRLCRFGADPAAVFLADHLDHPLEDLEKAAALHRPALIVVDTLAAFAGDDIEDPGNSSSWTLLMARLVRIARVHGAAILLLHHARKSDGTYRDSTAIGAAVDVLLELRPDQQESTVRHLKARGRFVVADTSVCLTAAGFSLASGGLSLEARVLAFVKATAGCSLRQVVKGVSGRDSDISGAIHALLSRGDLVDVGSAKGLALRVAVDAHAAGLGNALGNAPKADPLPE
jgi:hypothetical protein